MKESHGKRLMNQPIKNDYKGNGFAIDDIVGKNNFNINKVDSNTKILADGPSNVYSDFSMIENALGDINPILPEEEQCIEIKFKIQK